MINFYDLLKSDIVKFCAMLTLLGASAAWLIPMLPVDAGEDIVTDTIPQVQHVLGMIGTLLLVNIKSPKLQEVIQQWKLDERLSQTQALGGFVISFAVAVTIFLADGKFIQSPEWLTSAFGGLSAIFAAYLGNTSTPRSKD